jgi:hypothetical protein
MLSSWMAAMPQRWRLRHQVKRQAGQPGWFETPAVRGARLLRKPVLAGQRHSS